ncbi:plasmid stabilization protein ParE [Marinobacter fuscus]|uniref:Toxin n=1 Tax=Marinobacter fuscus TaxID=2109942 RepID=A0A2T1KED5_9GAMM|nr:type II toxin-antitoxin system RelE/ParE family toxin [Marinobacter fuscus]PSF08123.1 plasmid stabilization protein ParE [Marinobacter fuscus]
MSTFELTNQARFDLKSIAIYTQKKWGKEQRTIYLRQFDDTFHLLATSPEIGNDCGYIKSGYRKFPVTSHLIFYRTINDSKIQIVRILHKRMDARSQLTQP